MDFAQAVRGEMSRQGMSRSGLARRLVGKVGKTALYDFLWMPPERKPIKFPRGWSIPSGTVIVHPAKLPKRLPPKGINSVALGHIFDALQMGVKTGFVVPPTPTPEEPPAAYVPPQKIVHRKRIEPFPPHPSRNK